jgi:glycosyltransferase involved in cell wall biosynthesis
MRVAILGTRGIPANYGGFETFAEELSTRLALLGHEVIVYCRQRYPDSLYRGVWIRYVPTIRHKYLDTVAHTFLSTLHFVAHRADVALYCNGANAVFTVLPRLFGTPVALNVDGIERKRQKWNRLAKAWYLASEWLARFCPDVVITDAHAIQRYYLERYGKATRFIPYGAETGKVQTAGALRDLGVEAGRYFLYVSRMEPENRALEVREAFERVQTGMKLVLVGDAPYAAAYIARVRDTNDPRILIPGAIYGLRYRELGSHCFAYVHATEVGGTHPALIEAMGRGALVIYRNTPENAEVAEGAGIAFEPDNLAETMARVLAMSEPERDGYRRRALDRVRERYCWDRITREYEDLLAGLCGISTSPSQ